MPEGYKKEKFWEIYKNLPPELKKILFADETGDYLRIICQRAGISEELDKISDHVKQVFLGTLPPENFEMAIKQDLNLEIETAQKIAKEINHLVFDPVGPVLEKIYHPEDVQTEEEKPRIKKETEREIKNESRGDVYRESIE